MHPRSAMSWICLACTSLGCAAWDRMMAGPPVLMNGTPRSLRVELVAAGPGPLHIVLGPGASVPLSLLGPSSELEVYRAEDLVFARTRREVEDCIRTPECRGWQLTARSCQVDDSASRDAGALMEIARPRTLGRFPPLGGARACAGPWRAVAP